MRSDLHQNNLQRITTHYLNLFLPLIFIYFTLFTFTKVELGITKNNTVKILQKSHKFPGAQRAVGGHFLVTF